MTRHKTFISEQSRTSNTKLNFHRDEFFLDKNRLVVVVTNSPISSAQIFPDENFRTGQKLHSMVSAQEINGQDFICDKLHSMRADRRRNFQPRQTFSSSTRIDFSSWEIIYFGPERWSAKSKFETLGFFIRSEGEVRTPNWNFLRIKNKLE